MKTISKNILKIIGVVSYFFILDFAYQKMNIDRLIGDIEVFSGMFLFLGLIMLEKAYKDDNGKTAISGIELLVLAMHSLSIKHVITFFKYDFIKYLEISAIVFSIYYANTLKQLSDISEIVKEEPIKKEATKKKKEAKKDV